MHASRLMQGLSMGTKQAEVDNKITRAAKNALLRAVRTKTDHRFNSSLATWLQTL